MIHTKKLFLFSIVLFAPMVYAQVNPNASTERMALGHQFDNKINNTMANPAASDQDMDQIVKELEKATKEIDNFVKSLPPAEQAEFNRIVQQVEQKMKDTDADVLERFLTNQMNPEELDQFLGNVFEGITPPEEKATPATEKQTKATTKKEEKPTPKEVSKIDRALDTLNTIIKRTDAFIIKAQELPELAGKVKRWGKNGIIYDWDPSFEWDKVKKDIESLRQLAQKLVEKDPKDSTYKYLNDFIAQESLVNNIEKLKTTLVEYEPTIETSIFGLEKMNEAAKKALQRTISGYTEALYRLKVIDDIEKIFEKYEPRAKELREEKEKFEKEAAKAQKSSYFNRKEMVTVGSEDIGGGDYYSSYSPDYSSYNDYYGGSPSSSYSPSYDYTDYSTPSEESESKADDKEAAANKGSAKGGDKGNGGKKGKSSENGTKEEDKKDKDDKSGKDKSSDKSDKKSEIKKEAPVIEKSLKDITDSMNIAGLTLKNEETLKDLKKHILDKESKPDVSIVTLPITSLKKAKDAISTLKKEMDKKKDTQAMSRVQKRLEEITKEHKPVLEKTVKQIKEIEAISKDPDQFKEILIEKRVAYLGEQPVQPVTKAPQTTVEEPEEMPTVNILDLPKEWESVLKAVKDFNKKPELPVVTTLPVQPTQEVSTEEKK